MAVSFADDIRPLFRDSDIEVMKEYGLDLSSYDAVRAQAISIYARLADGSMPCDVPWPVEQIELLKRWMDSPRQHELFVPPMIRSKLSRLVMASFTLSWQRLASLGINAVLKSVFAGIIPIQKDRHYKNKSPLIRL
jgi:hypothetical protein